MKIKRQITLDKTHIADDIQMYAEILVNGFKYDEAKLSKKLSYHEYILFDQLLIQNLFNTTTEYAAYVQENISDCHRAQKMLCNKLKQYATEEIAPAFVKAANIYENEAAEFLPHSIVTVNEYMNEYDIDKCQTLKEIAHDIHLQLEAM